MREALAPCLLHMPVSSVVHQWAPKQYVQRSSKMTEEHATVYKENAAQHIPLVHGLAPRSSPKQCAPASLLCCHTAMQAGQCCAVVTTMFLTRRCVIAAACAGFWVHRLKRVQRTGTCPPHSKRCIKWHNTLC